MNQIDRIDAGVYRWALIPRGDLLDLCDKKPEPIAYFRDEAAARTCGLKMYGCYHEISELPTESLQEQA